MFARIALGLALALSAPVHAADQPTFVLMVKNQRFEPTDLQVPANAKFTLIVRNDDPKDEEFESYDLQREKVVEAGKQIEIVLGPLDPGRYEFWGDFHPDTARGYLVAR